jgi:hypothetical protein
MVSKVFKCECISYLFGALEVKKKKKKKQLRARYGPSSPTCSKEPYRPLHQLERVAPDARTRPGSPLVDFCDPFRPSAPPPAVNRAWVLVSRAGAAVNRGAAGSAGSRAVGVVGSSISSFHEKYFHNNIELFS